MNGQAGGDYRHDAAHESDIVQPSFKVSASLDLWSWLISLPGVKVHISLIGGKLQEIIRL